MFYLLLILGLLCAAIGVFVVGFGVPIRDTPFGSALLVAGSVAIIGGLITVGLVAMMAELRLVVQALKARLPAVARPSQEIEPPERRPAVARPSQDVEPPERRPAVARPSQDVEPPERRPAAAPPVRPSAERLSAERPNADTPPANAPGPAPEAAAPSPRRSEWMRRSLADSPSPALPAAPTPEARPETVRATRTADAPARTLPAFQSIRPPPDNPAGQPHRASTSAASNRLDTSWPSGRVPAGRDLSSPERGRPGPQFGRPSEPRPAPSPAGESAVAQPEIRPVSILKSGVIDEMSYTLFTDGSIEAQMPEGTVRFASIEELRQHLENQDG
jgi:hypothetical protein